MARVTVEDCVLKIPNRFELVLSASQRAREIGSGEALTIDRDNDKNSVVSLREIADEMVSLPELKESLIRGHQKIIAVDDDSDDVIDVMEGEQEWAAVAQDASDAEHVLEGEGIHEETSEDVASEADGEIVEEETMATGTES